MTKPNVYWSDARATAFGTGILDKIEKLWETANFDSIIERGDKVAIKVHWGETGTTRYLRPVLIRRIVDLVKTRAGGTPFVTDTGRRRFGVHARSQTSVEHVQLAAAHGFTSETMNAPLVIADGWTGSDHVEIGIPRGQHIKRTLLARGIAGADAMINVSHVKGHRLGVMGGAVKNAGIGCVSRDGKLLVHSADGRWRPQWDLSKCLGRKCAWLDACVKNCELGALDVKGDRVVYDEKKCQFCIWCWSFTAGIARCGVVQQPNIDGRGYLAPFMEAMTESAIGVVQHFEPGKVGHINFVMDVNQFCDCIEFTDVPFVSDQGIYAASGEDNAEAMLAVDKASLDAINQAAGLPRSIAEEKGCLEAGSNKLLRIYGADPYVQIAHGGKMLGRSIDYALQRVEPTQADVERTVRRFLRAWEDWNAMPWG